MSEILDEPTADDLSHLKKRHGCVTAWLILMIVGGALSAMSYFFFSDAIIQALPSKPSNFLLWGIGILGLVNVAFAIFLYQWKKLGFFGYIGTAIIAFGFNMLMGLGLLQSLAGLLGILLLYGILQIKNEHGKSAWSLLE